MSYQKSEAMKNKMTDVRNILIAQLERLNDDELQGEALKAELEKAEQMANIGKVLVESAKVEVIFLKVTGGTEGTGFMPAPEKIAEPKALSQRRKVYED